MVAVTRRRPTAPDAPSYSRADIEALSEKLKEPTWLRDSRLAAWELYEELPMPDRALEEWRRTDYRSLRWDEAGRMSASLDSRLTAIPAANREPLAGEEQGGFLAFINGEVVHSEAADSLSRQGIVFTDLSTACRLHEDLVRPNLMTRAVKPGEGKFAALHAALWTHGAFVYVPRGTAAELPIHIVMYNDQPGATLGHVLVIVEDGAQATVLVDYLSAQAQSQSVYVGATELLVGSGANLRYVSLQDWDRQMFEFSYQRARVGRDAALDWVIGTMGSRFVKSFIEVELDGTGANVQVSGMFFADKGQFFDLDTQQNHNAPLTTSNLLFKGAAKDTARSLWQGMIKSLPDMQKIDGFQACRNLVLSDEARMDAIPGLEIEADDVRCTHAATFGTLEEQPVFYLMSRGIPRDQAELMVAEGFFEELLERIPFERVQARLRASLEAKIIGSR
ncbi:MAG: Fe-S cluster assembly protein SufD [Anaerolineae bacterium]|nr:Fe-S cluster assembly protein SufD [Anaerolineae bacterium]NUQ02597.1 Fe-S cluster assembly protein SufD [Anaerolineae bacterium]